MKLKDLDTSTSSKSLAKVYESQAGKTLNVEALSPINAKVLLKKVRETIAEHHNDATARYKRHNSPAYTKLMMLEQTLAKAVLEYGSVPPTPTATPTAAKAGARGAVQVNMNDPKVKMAMQKAQRGQTLSPDEQQTMNAIALMQKEAKKQKRMVKEDEMQQAQVVLAAQDMVDQVQKMIEDISAMQYKDLPALTDSVRADIGADQAATFQTQANSALETLLGNLQNAKAGLDSAKGTLTGQEMAVPGEETDMEVDMTATDGEEEIDLDVDQLDQEADGEIDSDEEAEIAALGREKRA